MVVCVDTNHGKGKYSLWSVKTQTTEAKRKTKWESQQDF